MFSYYGSKSKIVHLYPPPLHNLIIEPFAGSARYALRYFDRDVILIDKNPVIVKIWKWLQECSANDILRLPRLKQGEKLSTYNLSEPERLFLGFCVTNAAASPRNTATWRASTDRPNLQNHRLAEVAKNLHKIRHWQIKLGNYADTPGVEATWFIDPPYFQGGEHYTFSTKQIDFSFLSAWVKSRQGQVIVCENSSAKWMPFLPLATIQGSIRKTTEVFWTNTPIERQAGLF